MGLFSKKYSTFNKSIIKTICKIPYNDSHFVPQGVCYVDGYYLLTMYDHTRISNSLILIFKDCELYKRIMLDDKYHCGGISYDEKSKSIFMTGFGSKNHSYVLKYEFKQLLSLVDDGMLISKEKYEVDNDNTLYSSASKHSSPSYLTCYDGYVFVGNYCKCDYLTKAVIKKYKVLKDGSLSKSVDIIKNPFSNTQGICVFKHNGEEYYLFSRSFGRKRNSLIHICKFSNSNFYIVSTMVLPAMLEQVSYAENNLVLIFESGAKIFKNSAITVNDEMFLINLDSVLSSKDKYVDFCKGTSLFTRNSKYKF